MIAQGDEMAVEDLAMPEEEAALQADGVTMLYFVNHVCERRNLEDMFRRIRRRELDQIIETGEEIHQLYLEFEREDDNGNTFHSDIIIEAILYTMIRKTEGMVQMARRTTSANANQFINEARAFIAACEGN